MWYVFEVITLLILFAFLFQVSEDHEYVLIAKDEDYNHAPKSRFMSFDGINQATIVQKKDFSGQLNSDFTIRMWMKHSNDETDEKEHIFCKSDERCKKIKFLFSLLSSPNKTSSFSKKSTSCCFIHPK